MRFHKQSLLFENFRPINQNMLLEKKASCRDIRKAKVTEKIPAKMLTQIASPESNGTCLFFW